MSLYDAFKTDASAEQDGIILDFGDFTVKIARAGGENKKFQKALRRRLDKHKRAIQFEALPEDVALRVLAECYADAVVLGWENIVDEIGEEIPYSREKCVELLMELPEFFAAIRAEAEKVSNFLTAKRKAIAGN